MKSSANCWKEFYNETRLKEQKKFFAITIIGYRALLDIPSKCALTVTIHVVVQLTVAR